MEWCGAAHGYWLYLLYVQEVVYRNLLHEMGHYFLDRRYQTNIPLVLRFDGVQSGLETYDIRGAIIWGGGDWA